MLRQIGGHYQRLNVFNNSFAKRRQFHVNISQRGGYAILMKSIQVWGRIILCFSALLLAGCAATIQYPAFPDQTKRVEDPGKARIYLIRKEKFFGSAVGINFFGSDPGVAVGPLVGTHTRMRLVGTIGPGSYLCWEEKPHSFTFPKTSGDTNSLYTLDLMAGEVYYLRIYIHSGWTKVTTKVDVLNETEGKALLKHCQPPSDYRKK
jgi:hypothetical protein